jgi:hypothetical protein
MDKRAEHLATLGLTPDASWDEVTQAYKDMMRVWHPDRFQSDERLRAKAEQQAQRINNAMSELRKMGKEPRQATRSSAHTTSDQGAGAKTYDNQERAQATQDTQRQQERPRQQSSSTRHSFMIAPLYIRQRFSSTILKVAFASAILYAAYDSLKTASGSPNQRAAALIFAFLSLDLGARNLALLLLPKPVASVEKNGLFFIKTGHLGWADIEGAWPVITPRFQHLSLMLSEHYLQKINIVTRAVMRLRKWLKTPHVTISFNGLNTDPVSFISSMKLRQVHHDISIEELPLQSNKIAVVAFIISLAAVAVTLVRCVLGLSSAPLDFIPYIVIFAVARATGVIARIIRS